MDIIVSNKEYAKLIKQLEFFDTTRNNLLTFSFTAVLTILGVSLTINMNSFNVWLCLIPFFLIIPFTARISYYRLASAHIHSFLRKFARDDMQFEIGTQVVTENGCKYYPQIAWLMNHEMVLLSFATSCIFYIKYIPIIENWTYINLISLIIPVFLSRLVYLITHSTYGYKKLLANFEAKWDSYSEHK